jgi:hypothetical protein
MMKTNWKWIVGILVCLGAAIGFYFLAIGMMDSVYAYRSPLSNNPPLPGEPVGEPLSGRVVYVLIDALRMDTAYDAEIMPTLNELRQQGAWAEMNSREPSYSATGYSVIFTGAWPELSDGPVFNLETEEIPAWTQDNLFSAAQRAGLQTAVSGYEWFGKLIPNDAVTAGFYTPGEDRVADREVVDAALPWLASGEYELVLIHLDQVDYAGHHEGGAADPNWAAAAARCDDLLAEIVAELDLSQDTLFISSDHGQVDAGGHGGSEKVAVTEPFVLVGAGVKPGEYGVVQMVDIAPTLAAILGLNIPASTQGQVRIEMLQLTAEQVTAIETAQKEQQAALSTAYVMAIGAELPVEAEGNVVLDPQEKMELARQEMVNAMRLPRLLIAGVLAVIPLAWLGWRWKKGTGWLLVGVAVFHLVFHLWYALIAGKGYTFSYVIGPMELVLDGMVKALVAFGLGWLVAMWGARFFRHGGRKAAEFTFSLALVTMVTLLLPVIWSYAWDGLYVGKFLPDFTRSYVALLSMVQGLAVGVAGLLYAGLAAGIAALMGRKK